MATIFLSDFLRELFKKKTSFYLPQNSESLHKKFVFWESKYFFKKEIYVNHGKLALNDDTKATDEEKKSAEEIKTESDDQIQDDNNLMSRRERNEYMKAFVGTKNVLKSEKLARLAKKDSIRNKSVRKKTNLKRSDKGFEAGTNSFDSRNASGPYGRSAERNGNSRKGKGHNIDNKLSKNDKRNNGRSDHGVNFSDSGGNRKLRNKNQTADIVNCNKISKPMSTKQKGKTRDGKLSDELTEKNQFPYIIRNEKSPSKSRNNSKGESTNSDEKDATMTLNHSGKVNESQRDTMVAAKNANAEEILNSNKNNVNGKIFSRNVNLPI